MYSRPTKRAAATRLLATALTSLACSLGMLLSIGPLHIQEAKEVETDSVVQM